MTKLRICCVAGARPNFIKIAPLMAEMRARPELAPMLVHTGQHFSPEMSDAFFRDLEIPAPDISLGAGGSTPTEQTADIMLRIEPVLRDLRPDLLLVVGDVTSTVASALTATRLGIRIAHIEAGLRSFDRSMPEEVNRVITDAVSDYLFVTEPSGRRNLAAESIPESRIFFVGNVMIDTLLRFRQRAAASDVLERAGLQPKSYALVTLHRPANVDDPRQLRKLAGVLERLSERLSVVFPMHPRTRARMEDAGVRPACIITMPPLGYIDFLRLMSDARVVLTDSGGVQEETTILQVPCLTLRENTERPVTIEQGTNELIGTDPNAIFEASVRILRQAPAANGRVPELWDGHASTRILDVLEAQLRPSVRRLACIAEEHKAAATVTV